MTLHEDHWLAVDDVQRLHVTEIELGLHRSGWASFVTIEREAGVWRNLAEAVDTYDALIEEYTNEICSRDALEIALSQSTGGVRERLEAHVQVSDADFRVKTVPDVERRLARYFRIAPEDGWWWHRIPASGPLLDQI